MSVVGAEPRETHIAGTASRTRGADGWTAWLVFAAVLLAAFAFLIWKGHGNTFVYDEWSWIEYRRSGLQSILGSYNDHLLVVPLAVYQLLFHTVGLADYAPYRLLVAVAHIACAAAAFEFARRRIGLAALLLVVPFAFLGAGWEFELQGLNFGFSASIAFGIGALLALDAGSRRGDVAASALLVIGLGFSEYAALFAMGIAVAQVVCDRSLRRAWVWAVPLLVYLAWFVGYYDPVPGGHDLVKVPKYVADMAASAAGGLFGTGLQSGRLVLVALTALVGWRLIRRRALSQSLIVTLVTLCGFWLLVAYGRAQLGRPWESHYVYTGAVLIILVIAESFRGIRLTRATASIATAVALVALVGNINAFDGGETYLHTASRTVAAELGALQLISRTAPPALVLDPRFAPQIQAGPYFAATRALGSTPADSPSQISHEPGYARTAARELLERAGDTSPRPPWQH